jgi:hypothetical protein
VAAKPVQQPENIVDGEFALAAVDELDGAPVLQIDAWN